MDKQAVIELSRKPAPADLAQHPDNSPICLRTELDHILKHRRAKNYVVPAADALKDPT